MFKRVRRWFGIRTTSEVVQTQRRLNGMSALIRDEESTGEEVLRYVVKNSLEDAGFAELWHMAFFLMTVSGQVGSNILPDVNEDSTEECWEIY